MSGGTFLYFAYGSNMLTARLQAPERCPSASPLGVAELRGHELRWHKRSKKDGSGKCDIAASTAPDASMFGVLYEIANPEKSALDHEEGLNKGYEAVDVALLFNGTSLLARSYRATDTDPALRPYTWYHALVITGAKQHGLPAEYVAGLESVLADVDPDQTRHNNNMALIGEVRA